MGTGNQSSLSGSGSAGKPRCHAELWGAFRFSAQLRGRFVCRYTWDTKGETASQQFTTEEALCTRLERTVGALGLVKGGAAGMRITWPAFISQIDTSSMDGFFPTLPKARRLGNRRRTRQTDADGRKRKRRRKRDKPHSDE